MVKVVVGFVLVKKGVWIHNIVAPVAAEEEICLIKLQNERKQGATFGRFPAFAYSCSSFNASSACRASA